MTREHDDRCESEYESSAHAWTPCGCWASREEAEAMLARAERAETERDEAVAKVARVRDLIDGYATGVRGAFATLTHIDAALDTPATEGGEGA